VFWSKKGNRPKTLSQVMTKNPRTVSPNHRLSTARKLMTKYGVRHVPVIEADKIVTVISERDMELVPKLFPGRTENEVLVEELCLFDPFIADEQAELTVVLKQMLKEKIGCVLVTRNKKLTGIFTMIDAGKLLLELLDNKHQPL
jgi:CBS domain-containing protein